MLQQQLSDDPLITTDVQTPDSERVDSPETTVPEAWPGPLRHTRERNIPARPGTGEYPENCYV